MLCHRNYVCCKLIASLVNNRPTSSHILIQKQIQIKFYPPHLTLYYVHSNTLPSHHQSNTIISYIHRATHTHTHTFEIQNFRLIKQNYLKPTIISGVQISRLSLCVRMCVCVCASACYQNFSPSIGSASRTRCV